MRIYSLMIISVLVSFCASSQTLPAFSFTNAKNEKTTPAVLPQDKPVIVFYFDPFCDKCEAQAAAWNTKKTKLSGITLLCVSNATDEENEAFRKKYFAGMQNVFMCKDDTFQFDQWFGYSEAPAIYVYNKTRKRTAVFTNMVTSEVLLDASVKTP